MCVQRTAKVGKARNPKPVDKFRKETNEGEYIKIAFEKIKFLRTFIPWIAHLEKEACARSHFAHIANNLKINLETDLVEFGVSSTTKNDLEKIKKFLEAARIYKRLIDEVPDFKAKELGTAEGYFPEIVEVGEFGSVSLNYALEAGKKFGLKK